MILAACMCFLYLSRYVMILAACMSFFFLIVRASCISFSLTLDSRCMYELFLSDWPFYIKAFLIYPLSLRSFFIWYFLSIFPCIFLSPANPNRGCFRVFRANIGSGGWSVWVAQVLWKKLGLKGLKNVFFNAKTSFLKPNFPSGGKGLVGAH